MKYKDIIGYSKPKKKLIKEQIKSQPKKNKILENIKKDLNEWNDTTFRNAPKRWSGASDNGLTEFEKQGGKDIIKEVGSASLHKKMMQNIANGEGYYRGIVENYAAFLKQEGHTKEAKELMSKYVTLTSKFSHWMKTKWVKVIRKMI